MTIGNITMGGAGKTPVVLSIAKILKNNSNKKISILTRGYKGKLNGPIMVENHHTIKDVGDEALLLKKEAPTCISKNRIEGIKFLEKQGYDIIITDDGLQDKRFFKNLSILVIDSYFGLGSEMIFPAGPLRETLSSGLSKADLALIIGNGNYKLNSKTTPILRANIINKILLTNEKLVAFAGIGNPNKFFQTIKDAEADIVDQVSFPDHHEYSKKDLEKLIKLAKEHDAKLITTEKDYVRISQGYQDKIKTLPIELIWEENEILMKEINTKLLDKKDF